MEKEEIEKSFIALFQKCYLARRKFVILEEFLKITDGDKINEIIIPIIDSLEDSIIMDLSVLYENRTDTVNLKEIFKYMHQYGINNNEKYISEYADENIEKLNDISKKNKKIKKLVIERGNKTGHLSKKYVLDNAFDLEEYKLSLNDIKEIISEAFQILLDINKIFFKTDIIYDEVDDNVLRIKLKKILINSKSGE